MTSNGMNTAPDINPYHSSIKSYAIGFVLSIVLTLIPLGLIAIHNARGHTFPTHQELRAALVLLAVVQLMVQLYFFLHFGREQKPRWNMIAASFAIFVVFVIVAGSLWIMSHLQHTDVSNLYQNGVVTPANEQD